MQDSTGQWETLRCRMVLNRAESCRTVQHKIVLVYYVLGETVSLLLRSHKKVELNSLVLSQSERQLDFAESHGAP